MVDVSLQIVDVHRDPHAARRLASGKYRINQELNEEWADIQNNGPYVLNLQGRVLACVKRQGLIKAPRGFETLRYAQLRANSTIPLQPGQKVRVFTGEQPRSSTHITDGTRLSRVLWLVQNTYLWLPEGNEAHLYLSLQDLRQAKAPLARFLLR
ncbi:MAG: hypothetical protein ACAI44_40680 [Candidatus Sericytochromatia bacterium]